ncbi:MAG: CYTH domain-containing protein [Magnetococcales bacterium]|nr:CYTH domain-containing protein [Magnetococcales bacterium]
MATEIERKFLVKGEGWRELGNGEMFRQGFLSTTKERVVRVRVAGEQAWLTIKGATQGVSRAEFEYPIPVQDALVLLNDLCERPLIEKVRYKIPHAGMLWEVDEFMGENQGLVIAEVELQDASQTPALPSWVGDEVSHDPRYFNANLVKNPYANWS